MHTRTRMAINHDKNHVEIVTTLLLGNMPKADRMLIHLMNWRLLKSKEFTAIKLMGAPFNAIRKGVCSTSRW